LNNRSECTIKCDWSGNDIIRSQVIKDNSGRFTVRSLTTKSIITNSEEELLQSITSALSNRQTGSSNVHDQSSRSHAILIAEIVTKDLVSARESILQAEADIIPIGHKMNELQIQLQDQGAYKDQ